MSMILNESKLNVKYDVQYVYENNKRLKKLLLIFLNG